MYLQEMHLFSTAATAAPAMLSWCKHSRARCSEHQPRLLFLGKNPSGNFCMLEHLCMTAFRRSCT